MSCNNLLVFIFYTQDFTSTFGNIPMTCSVETITTDTIFLIQLIRQTIHISLSRHRLMESRIEYTHLRNTRNQRFHSGNTFQVSRIMQRSQVRTFNNFIQYFFCQQNTGSELLTTMYHTMTYRINFLIILDATIRIICQYTQDKLNTSLMFWNILFQDHLLTILICQFQESARQTDLFNTTLGHHIARSHIKQLIFDRTTTAIQY